MILRDKNNTVLRGCCDVDAINTYLAKKNKIFEGSFLSSENTRLFTRGHSIILDCIINNTYINDLDSEFFKSMILDKNTKYIVLSILQEFGTGLYYNLTNGTYFIYGDSKHDFSGFLLEKYNYSYTFKFLGHQDIEKSISIYTDFITKYPNKNFIFLLGPENEIGDKESSGVFKDSSPFFKELNKKLMHNFGDVPNVSFVDPNPLIRRHYFDNRYFYYNKLSICHYKRKVYYLMAKELQKLTSSCVKASLRNECVRDFKRFYRKLKSYLKTLLK